MCVDGLFVGCPRFGVGVAAVRSASLGEQDLEWCQITHDASNTGLNDRPERQPCQLRPGIVCVRKDDTKHCKDDDETSKREHAKECKS